jgi:23S rRNA pseudouridine955/2504/2580 synthase
MRLLTIGENDAGQRLDKFLMKTLRTLPPSLMYKAIRTKKIKVNRKRAEGGRILSEGDTISLFLSDDFFTNDADPADLYSRIRPSFRIVYEDDNLLLCDKPAGLSVHEDNDDNVNTLITQIRSYLFQKGDYHPEKEQSFAPALCNRIDRNTGGIVIAAKNAASLREINTLIRERKLSKRYLCAVHGTLEKKEDTLRAYLVKNSETNTVSVFSHPVGNGKEILTRYRVLEEKDGLSLLEVELLTGRTHQIRAHFAYLGHPLLGDGKYGVNRDDKKRGYRFQALYSYRLIFSGGSLLSYLNGKTFTVSPESIPFLSLFSENALSRIRPEEVTR